MTFPVDDVVPAAEPLPVRPLGSFFPEALAIGGDPARPVVAPDGVHPLLSAVARAFAEHRPLVLSPDAVWLTIAQGVAQHNRLTAPPGIDRQRLEATHFGPTPTDSDSWRDFVAVFSGQLPEGDLFACDFSTSTEVERVAGQIVQLDAYSPWYSLWLTCVCGIPEITLTGTVDDWRRIRTRIDALAQFGLETWCRSLAPITDHFVRAAAGEADTAFWQRIYQPSDAYGGEVINGWVTRLYPYLEEQGALDRPNPALEQPLEKPGPGIRSESIPATLSRVVVNVNDRVEGQNRAIALHGGLVAVAQDDDGALRPVAGWHLTHAEPRIDDVLDRIVRDHQTTEPQPGHLISASAELVALYHRMGSATLFDGAWRLRPIDEHGHVIRGMGWPSLLMIIDLPDGRSLGAAIDSTTQTLHWVAARVEMVGVGDLEQAVLAEDPAEVPVYGTSLAMLLEAALESGGDLHHLETGRLAHLDADPVEKPRRAARSLPALPAPELGLDEQLAQIRRAKETAIDEQDFELAAHLRDQEKRLAADEPVSAPDA